jgi:putative ABC transport system permease protein
VGVGTLCGACLSVILVYIINRQSFGWTLRLTFPPWSVGIDLGLIFLTALVAGLWPAHQAARVRLTETLRME